MNKHLRNFISLTLVAVMAVSGYKIVTTLLDYKKASDTYTEIRENYSPEAEEGFMEDDLKNINPDYRLRLFVENTNILSSCILRKQRLLSVQRFSWRGLKIGNTVYGL